MKIEIEANNIPENAKPIAKIVFALYEDPSDGYMHIAVPFDISPTTKRTNVIFVHKIVELARSYLNKCLTIAKKEYESEVKNG